MTFEGKEMGNINIAVVEGNLTRAAELSFWSDGTPYCKFTVANNESWKTAEGNYESIPSYIDCLLKGKYAESMSKYLTRGRRITVTGRLKQQSWTADDGQKHSRIVIKVSEISLAPAARPAEERQEPDGRRRDGVAAEPETRNTGDGFRDGYAPAESGEWSDTEMFDGNEIPF